MEEIFDCGRDIDELLDLTLDEIREKRQDRRDSDDWEREMVRKEKAQQAIDDAKQDRDSLEYWVQTNDKFNYDNEVASIKRCGRVVPNVPWNDNGVVGETERDWVDSHKYNPKED